MTENFAFGAYRSDFERRSEKAKKGIEGLYGSSGQRVFADDFHQQQVDQQLQPVQQAVEEIFELCERADSEAKKLESLAHLDPLTSLDTADLIRLSAAQDLAKDEIAQFELLPQQFADRLDAVLAHGDKVSKVLHVLYGRPIAEKSGDLILHQKIAALDEAIYGKQRIAAAQAAEQAEVLRKEAAELRFFARYTFAELNGGNKAALEQRVVDYGGPF